MVLVGGLVAEEGVIVPPKRQGSIETGRLRVRMAYWRSGSRRRRPMKAVVPGGEEP